MRCFSRLVPSMQPGRCSLKHLLGFCIAGDDIPTHLRIAQKQQRRQQLTLGLNSTQVSMMMA